MRHPRSDALLIDGSHGEGGGQVLRTALSLAALTGRALRIEAIRAGRRRPGLAAQHLTAVRAAAEICRASVEGDSLGSQAIEFRPGGPVRPGDYSFDVGAARQGGSAGAVTLVLQTLTLPLALAGGRSRVVVRGGTHMPWSPSADYLETAWLPLLRRTGLAVSLKTSTTGWYPIGRGEVEMTVAGLGADQGGGPRPVDLVERGRLLRVSGRAIAANLPDHIPRRMVERAGVLLASLGVELQLAPTSAQAACPGAGLFLAAHYEGVTCGFSAIGERGKPSEAVAEEAVAALLEHFRSGAAADRHLADQILLPLALADGPSRFSAERATLHLETNAWVIGRFDLAEVAIERRPDGTALVQVVPRGPTGSGPAVRTGP